MMRKRVIVWMCVCMVLTGTVAVAEESQDLVRAKIGIQIRTEEGSRLAKSFERLHAGDQLAIYVQPEPEPASIYVLHSSEKQKVTWLNQGIQYKVMMNNILRIPGRGFLEVDGKSALEEIIIICSPNELADLENHLKNGGFSYEDWTKYKNSLDKKMIDLSGSLEKPLNMAGTVRPLPDTFWKVYAEEKEEIRIFSGNSLVMKRYTFEVLDTLKK